MTLLSGLKRLPFIGSKSLKLTRNFNSKPSMIKPMNKLNRSIGLKGFHTLPTLLNFKPLNEINNLEDQFQFNDIIDLPYKKVLVLGSGGLSIGQAGEFDYSGSQAIKALKQSGVSTVLINPNIATIQTGEGLADKVYFSPLTLNFIEEVIKKERPDGILLTFGGQTGLNVGIELDEAGVFEKYDVKVLGTSIQTLKLSEDRDLFAMELKKIGIPVAESFAVTSVDHAIKAANEIGYPLIIRSAYALGGLGSGFVNDESELISLATKSLTLSPQILVEKSMKGWKEIEYEVIRDKEDNCITICNMENLDPLGIHTGDSIVVAPSQTLSDEEYHMLRTAAIKIVRHMQVVGECNVQYALNPKSLEFKVIEMNARLSRSSALASKATGYPLAFVAAKLGLGYSLPNLKNAVTKVTTACFEPSLDYIVTKVPRWDLQKFVGVEDKIGSSMKSIGEVMAIGRTFEESIQKALRMVDPTILGYQPTKGMDLINEKELRYQLINPTPKRLMYVASAMDHFNYDVDKLHDITKIDKWFLYKLESLISHSKGLKTLSLDQLTKDLLLKSKQLGFSDLQIADRLKVEALKVRELRLNYGLLPKVKRIDTLAGEYPTSTNYLYLTYNATHSDLTFDQHGVLVLGSGVYRIGSSVEFDWCNVSSVRALTEMKLNTVVINCNPETVSTDFDECDRLYFEELSLETVLDIYQIEQNQGVVISMGGQLPQNIASDLNDNGCHVLGTPTSMIDQAEDRAKFSDILDQIGIDQPQWSALTNKKDIEQFVNKVGYPVLIRPSYVLSGSAMNVAYNHDQLHEFLEMAADVSPKYPVVISKIISEAQELDIDGVAHSGSVIQLAISEHIEPAGVHSGDASLILPPITVPQDAQYKLASIADKLADRFDITGPFNLQVIRKVDKDGNESLKVIELNLRASRSFPFISKRLGTNFSRLATQAIVKKSLPHLLKSDVELKPQPFVNNFESGKYAIKVPQFSWTRLPGADPMLSVEMASTGEVAAFANDPHDAYLLALQSLNRFQLPEHTILLCHGDTNSIDSTKLEVIAKGLTQLGYNIYVIGSNLKNQLDQLNITYQPIQLLPNQTITDTKLQIQNLLHKNKVELVLDLTLQKPNLKVLLNQESIGEQDDSIKGYLTRRSAVDVGIPLITDINQVTFFIKALIKANVNYPDQKNVKGLSNGLLAWKDNKILG